MLPLPGPPQPEIRQLTAEEYLSLAPRFEGRGHQLPSPDVATAVGIFDDGKIVGYQVLQLRLHVQPTEIDEGYANLFTALCRKSEETIFAKCGPTWAYLFVEPDTDLHKLAASRGMTDEPWVVMSKLVQQPVAAVLLPVESTVATPITEEEIEQYPAEEVAA